MSSSKKIVLIGGCFDILHFGHISFLKKAKTLGDFLIVALESDESVRKLKGKNRPIHSQSQRKEMLEALKFVDKVVKLKGILTDKDYFKLVEDLKPAIIATTKGDPIIIKKKQQAQDIGSKLVVLPKIQTKSTTEIVKIYSY